MKDEQITSKLRFKSGYSLNVALSKSQVISKTVRSYFQEEIYSPLQIYI